MIGDMRTVVVTFRPRTGVNEDLERWVSLVDVGLNTATTTTFDGNPAITVRVRVRCSRRSAPVAARQWVEDRTGGLPIDVLRVMLLATPPSDLTAALVLTQGPKPSRSSRMRMWARELGLFDIGHQVWTSPWHVASTNLATTVAGPDTTGAEIPGNVASRPYLGANARPDASRKERIALFSAYLISVLLPVAAGFSIDRWRAAGTWLAAFLTCLLCVFFQVKVLFFSPERHLGTNVIAACGLVTSTFVFGYVMASEGNLPSIRMLLGSFLLIAYGYGLWFVLDAHPRLRQPFGVTALVGPVLAGGSMLLSWSFEAVAGIPATSIALTWPEQVWMVWPVLKQTVIVMFVLFSGYGWIRYFGIWASARHLWRFMSPLLIVLYLLTALISGIQQTQAQTLDVSTQLQQGKTPGGVLGSKIRWVCVAKISAGRLASYGGAPVTFDRPLAHVLTNDDRIWLWDPRAKGSNPQAVSYPTDSLALRWVATGTSSCRG